MSDENRNESGKFASVEPLFGQAELEARAGFSPMTPPKKDDGEFTTAREAAETLVDKKANAAIVPVLYQDKDGAPIDPSKTVSIEQAASDLAAFRGADSENRGKDISSDFAAAIDKMRAEAIKGDPDLAEHFGIEPPTADKDNVTSGDTAPSTADKPETAASDGLDPKLEEVLKHPQIREAIELQIAEADKARQSYVDGLNAASDYARLAFVDQFPEFTQVPQEQWPAVLQAISVQDPAKFQRINAAVARSEQLRVHQQHEQQRQAETSRRQFADYAKAEDARFDAMVPNVKPEVMAEVMAPFKEAGIDHAAFLRLANSNELMRSALGQKILYEAAQYRLAQKIARAVPTRPVPPVQRPGTSQPRDTASPTIAKLEKEFASATGTNQIRLAAKLTQARRGAKDRDR